METTNVDVRGPCPAGRRAETPRLLQEPEFPHSRRRDPHIAHEEASGKLGRVPVAGRFGYGDCGSSNYTKAEHVPVTRWPAGYPIDLFHVLPLLGGLPFPFRLHGARGGW